jgi:hypothetical protein
MVADASKSQRLGIVGEDAENAAPARSVADPPRRLVVDARGDEPLQLAALGVQHTQRGVARAGQLKRCLEHARQQCVDVELGDDESPDLDQRAQSFCFEPLGDRRLPQSSSSMPGHDTRSALGLGGSLGQGTE